MRFAFSVVLLMIILRSDIVLAQIGSGNYDAVPAYSEDFAGGKPKFNWIIDPAAQNVVNALRAPEYSSATPNLIAPAILEDDPLATATAGGAMVVGVFSEDLISNFGLNYVIADNSINGGTGDNLTLLVDYKITARIWTLGTSEYTSLGEQDRWAVGPAFHVGAGGGDLFNGAIFNQVGSLGNGPGTYTRGLISNGKLTSEPLAQGGWRLYSIMVLGDEVAAGFDANGDGRINEADPAEFITGLNRDTTDGRRGPPGINCVGEVTRDVYPLFVDTFDIYLPRTDFYDTWTLY